MIKYIKKDSLLIAKAVGYRVFGTLCTVAISYVFTGSIRVSAAIGVAEVVSKIVLYYAYDKLWSVLVARERKPS